MIAIDTNIVVRLLTDDHPVQSPRARSVIEANQALVPTTVLLESEWVLRSLYGFDRLSIAAAFRRLAGLTNIVLENPTLVAKALLGLDQGLDFADALHLASVEGCEAFVTFDEQLIRKSRRIEGARARGP